MIAVITWWAIRWLFLMLSATESLALCCCSAFQFSVTRILLFKDSQIVSFNMLTVFFSLNYQIIYRYVLFPQKNAKKYIFLVKWLHPNQFELWSKYLSGRVRKTCRREIWNKRTWSNWCALISLFVYFDCPQSTKKPKKSLIVVYDKTIWC